jgi:EAL domain-containing protein (putative c-di-GMP-specific phosphodiesterase class I)
LKGLLRRLRGKSSEGLSVEKQTATAPRAEPGIQDSAQVRAYSRLKLEGELGEALERGELELHYQPIVHLESEKVAGFEALIRWRHPFRGLVPPGEFVGVAESSGIIVPMGLWIAREACQTLSLLSEMDAGRWADPARGPFMGINVSPRQLADPHFLDRVRGILEDTGVQPLNIELEITEDLLLENPEETLARLRSLKAMGLGLVIDDFGTGYSSLSYVNRFPIDIIKVDRSFVLTMLEEEASKRIVAAVVGLARDLGLATIAEGIETPDQLARLKKLGCDYGQGFLLSRPIPGKELLENI